MAMDESRLAAVPNAFYDLIVFITPSAILLVGGVLGLKGISWVEASGIGGISGSSLILLILVGLVAAYELGRMAEAWSAALIQRPLAAIAKRAGADPDFLRRHPDVYAALGLQPSSDGRVADKWVIYEFAFLADAGIGGDLLKRYAWEKLSRSSAFAYLVLFAASVGTGGAYLFGGIELPVSEWGFGGWAYTLGTGALLLLTAAEYYKRNVWNFDLLVKVVPVLVEAYRFKREGS